MNEQAPSNSLLYGAKSKVGEIKATLLDMRVNGLRGDLPSDEALLLIDEIERLQDRFDIVQEQLEKVVKERNELRQAAQDAEVKKLASDPQPTASKDRLAELVDELEHAAEVYGRSGGQSAKHDVRDARAALLTACSADEPQPAASNEKIDPWPAEKCKAAKLIKYEHGGGRLYLERDGESRELIADFYNADTRDYIMGLIRAGHEPSALRIAAERVRDHACAYGAPADSLLVKRELIGYLAQALQGSITVRAAQPPEVGRLRAALKKYGRHQRDCYVAGYGPKECACGLEQALQPSETKVVSCVCGDSSAPGVTHRVDGPCFLTASGEVP